MIDKNVLMANAAILTAISSNPKGNIPDKPMKLTLAITTFNRYELLLESFAGLINDDRIDEILIMDDHSEDKYWNKVQQLPKFNPKIKVVRQLQNRGMSINKRDAVFNSKNEWVILGDSDNKFPQSYIDAFFKLEKFHPHIIYCPSFAAPNFDYRKYKGITFFKSSSFQLLLKDTEFSCLMNTANYVVNKNEYLKVWEQNDLVKSADTIWMNYLWLKSGNAFYVVPGMEYEHRVHKGSGFMEDVAYNMGKAEEIKKLILEL